MEGSFDLRQYKLEQLKISRQVMPDTWVGHAVISIEQNDDLDTYTKAEVLQHTRNILEEKDLPSEEVAEKIIDRLT